MTDKVLKALQDLHGQKAGGLQHIVNGWQAFADGDRKGTQLLLSLLAEAFLPAPETNRPCPLLNERTSTTDELKFQLDAVIELAGQTRTHFLNEFDPPKESLPSFDWWFRSIELRAETVRAFRAGTQKSSQFRLFLENQLTAYRKLFNTHVWKTGDVQVHGRPAAQQRLEQLQNQLAEGLADIVEDTCGWEDPAAAFLAETLVCLHTDGNPQLTAPMANDDEIGRTWVLIAIDDPLNTLPQPSGMVLRLEIDVIANGCGSLYPCPNLAAHIVPFECFQTSFLNAWQLVLSRFVATHSARRQDYRWRMAPIDLTSSEPHAVVSEEVLWHRQRRMLMLSQLTGRSGEVAIAAALKSAIDQVPLDQHVVATGKLNDQSALGETAPLVEVFSVLHKGVGITDLTRRAYRLCEINQLVVAHTQTIPGDLPDSLTRRDATDFASAFEWLSKDAVLTQHLKQKFLARATKFFANECFGTEEEPLGSYILNPMTRPPDNRDPKEAHTPNEETNKPSPIPLDDAARTKILECKVRKEPDTESEGHAIRRLMLVADSGIGKTTLLRRIQYELSQQSGPMLPLLLDSLDRYLEKTDEQTFVEFIYSQHKNLFPGEHKSDADHTRNLKWLKRKLRAGEVCFLLDALDQTSDHWKNLQTVANFFPACPLILTLRPAAVDSRSDGFDFSRWDRVDVGHLRPRDARVYLGEYAQLFFQKVESVDLDVVWKFWHRDEARTNFDEEALDRAVDEDSVLTIPLILNMLRDFAVSNGISTDSTDQQYVELKNRYSIYEMVICGDGGLIDRGIKKLNADEKDVFFNGKDTIDLLSVAALEKLQQHDFDKDVSQEQRTSILKKIITEAPGTKKRTAEEALTQLNLVTVNSIFDMDSGMTWRHRSFFEFLGGRKLAENLASDTVVEQKGVCKLLYQVHRTPGVFSEDATTTTETHGSIRNQPAKQWTEWHWTLRFALAHSATTKLHAQEKFATELLAVGNPWVTYVSAVHDSINLSPSVDALIRWLVHRNRIDRFDFTDAVSGIDISKLRLQALNAVQQLNGCLVPDDLHIEGNLHEFKTAQRTLLACLGARKFRDAGYMSALGELTYLMESKCKNYRTSPTMLEVLRADEQEKLSDYLGESRWIQFPKCGIEFADFPVTNELFEIYSPCHIRWRSRYSSQYDQPVLYVSGVMAIEFCRWISTFDSKYVYTLPKAEEWDFACRSESTSDPLWEIEDPAGLCWCIESRTEERTRSRRDALQAHAEQEIRHSSHKVQRNTICRGGVGLLDMLGNVWEMCVSDYGCEALDAPKFVAVGGAWDEAMAACRLGEYDAVDPFDRDNAVGFRLCRRLR